MKVISRSNADFTLKRSPIHSKNKKGDLEVDLEVNSRSDQGQTGFIPFPMIVKTVKSVALISTPQGHSRSPQGHLKVIGLRSNMFDSESNFL